MRFQWTALACLLFALASRTPAQTTSLAQDVSTLAINVVYSHASGVLRLNGVPINRFGEGEPLGKAAGTLFVGNGPANFGINGPNTLDLEVEKAAPDASAELLVFNAGADQGSEGGMDHPLFRRKITGVGKVEFSVTLRNVPHHLFDDATATGDPKAVLTAVQALHKALASVDMKAVAASLRPGFETMPEAKTPGSFDAMIGGFEGSLKDSRVAPLEANLKVETFYDGRLLRVTNADGSAPIRAASKKLGSDGQPEGMLEIGEFWCNRNGSWVLLPN
jgi:hypothetical protein